MWTASALGRRAFGTAPEDDDDGMMDALITLRDVAKAKFDEVRRRDASRARCIA